MKYIIIQFLVVASFVLTSIDAKAQNQSKVRNDQGISFKVHAEKNGTHITGFGVSGLIRSNEQGKKQLQEAFKKFEAHLNLIFTPGDYTSEEYVTCKLYSKRAVTVSEVRDILLSLGYDFAASSVEVTSKKVNPSLK